MDLDISKTRMREALALVLDLVEMGSPKTLRTALLSSPVYSINERLRDLGEWAFRLQALSSYPNFDATIGLNSPAFPPSRRPRYRIFPGL